MADECGVCGGEGYYPIIDMKGTERYSIRCPECYGSGEEYKEPQEEAGGFPPRSTAAKITTTDQMREYLDRVWGVEK